MELLRGNRIGAGISGHELYWWIADGEQGPELIVEGDGYRSCVLRCSDDGTWRGQYLSRPEMPVELIPEPSRCKAHASRNSGSEGVMASLLDRMLDAYAALPWDSEMMRDFVGAIRTLATLDATLAERLHGELNGDTHGTRARLLQLALEGLAEPSCWAERGGIAPGHKFLNQNFNDFAEGLYERLD
jgi:hypothetical protein